VNKELVTTDKTRKLEESLKDERVFSEKQIVAAEKIFTKWLHFIVAETGYGKIECFIDRGKKIIDISPTSSIRIFKE